MKIASFCQKLCSSENERKDKAKDLYQRAGNCFKLSKDFDKAASAYKKCADTEDDVPVASGIYVEAAMCMKKVNTSEAVKIMEEAIKGYSESGDLRYVTKFVIQHPTLGCEILATDR